MTRSKAHAPFVTALFVIATFIGVAHAKDDPLFSLTPEHFRDTATVKDDALDTSAVISSEAGYSERHGWLKIVSNDEFLRVFIDKKTGVRSFQIYAWIDYEASGWRYYDLVNYQAATGPIMVSLTGINRDVSNCSSVGFCHYVEQFGFTVDEQLLRAIAVGYVPGQAAAWKFKFRAHSGDEFLDGLSNAEVVGVLAKVDEYVAAHNLTRPARAPFGISMVMTTPSVERPRVGALVVSVTDGSTAQKAGLMVGDVMYDYDGHSVEQLPMLQQQIGASAAGSTVDFKILRGSAEMTLTAHF